VRPLTDRQQQVLDAIITHFRQTGRWPTYRELGLTLGFSSTSTVHSHVHALARKGHVRVAGRKGIVMAGDQTPAVLPAAATLLVVEEAIKIYSELVSQGATHEAARRRALRWAAEALSALPEAHDGEKNRKTTEESEQ
jgi:repressor LexA